jgi:hypothetical protein
MGFIRGAVITLFSIVLFILLFLMSLTAILSSSLSYNTLQPALKTYAGDMLQGLTDSENIFSAENQVYMNNYCSISTDYMFTYDNYSFVIPCGTIEQGKDAIINYTVDNFVSQIYYTEYSCEFWQCVKTSPVPLVLLSQKAKDYWHEKFLVLLGLSIVLYGLIFFISKNRPTTFIVTGVLLILSSLPFRSLHWALRFIPEKFSGIFSVFFTRAHNVFVAVLIIGIVFIVWGILCKIFGWKMEFGEEDSEVKDSEEKQQSNLRYKKKSK